MALFGTPTYAGTAGGEVHVARPSDVQAGHIILIAVRAQSSSNGADTVPDGFTRLGAAPALPSTQYRTNGIYWKIAGDNESATYRIGIPGGGGRVAVMCIGLIPDFRRPLNIFSESPYADPTFSEQPTEIEALTLLMFGTEATDGNSTSPQSLPEGYNLLGFTQHDLGTGTSGSRTSVGLAYRTELDTTLAAESVTWAAGAASAALRISMEDAFPSVPEEVAPKALSISVNGALTPVEASIQVGGTLSPVKAARLWRSGFKASESAVANGATWAHRGLSASNPEMTQAAYDDAVARGFGALEFSCARSSDGVWFGLHDETFDRTSKQTGTPKAAEVTWEQAQSYRTALNSSKPEGEPLYRLEDFVRKYKDSHTLILDPKYGVSHAPEFLNYVQSLGVDPGNVIMKFFGVGSGSTWFADEARARGFKTWGYFYSDNLASGDLERDQGHWDYLGYPYSAPQEEWDQVLAYGKPVVAHIAQSQANYDTGIAKGATAVQCASQTISPVT